MASKPLLPDWPRLMAEPVAAAYISLSPSTLRTLRLRTRRVGRRVLYDRRDLDTWVDGMSGQPLDERQQEEESARIERMFLEKRRARG